MSTEAKRPTKERKITAETYFKNKTHIICMKKRGASDLYVIRVKMINLQRKVRPLKSESPGNKEN